MSKFDLFTAKYALDSFVDQYRDKHGIDAGNFQDWHKLANHMRRWADEIMDDVRPAREAAQAAELDAFEATTGQTLRVDGTRTQRVGRPTIRKDPPLPSNIKPKVFGADTRVCRLSYDKQETLIIKLANYPEPGWSQKANLEDVRKLANKEGFGVLFMTENKWQTRNPDYKK